MLFSAAFFFDCLVSFRLSFVSNFTVRKCFGAISLQKCTVEVMINLQRWLVCPQMCCWCLTLHTWRRNKTYTIHEHKEGKREKERGQENVWITNVGGSITIYANGTRTICTIASVFFFSLHFFFVVSSHNWYLCAFLSMYFSFFFTNFCCAACC